MPHSKFIMPIVLMVVLQFLAGCIPVHDIQSSETKTATEELQMKQIRDCQDRHPQGPSRTGETVQEFIQDYTFIENSPAPDLQKELNAVSKYEVESLGVIEKIHVLNLAMDSRVSANDLIFLKGMLDSFEFTSEEDDNVRQFAETLKAIAQKLVVVRLHNGILNKELETCLKSNIILEQNVMDHQQREEGLQKQIQGLKDIEKIIINREKTDLPTQAVKP